MKKNSGVVRDVRLRKKLLEAAARSDGREVDDLASLDDGSVGGMSLGSMRSGISQLTFRSYASRGPNVIPNAIGTPKNRSKVMQTSREAISDYSTNTYVTSSGQVLSTPSPKRIYRSPRRSSGKRGPPVIVEQPFASLLTTPMKNVQSPVKQLTPLGLKTQKASSTVLRKRLSRRISGVPAIKGGSNIVDHAETNGEEFKRQLSSINEAEDSYISKSKSNEETPEKVVSNANKPQAEITTVALEVIEAHLRHLKELEVAVSKEKELLADLEKLAGSKLLGADINCAEVTTQLAMLSEDQVCDYFEALHICVNKQLDSSENFLGEMEKISQGGEESGPMMQIPDLSV